MANPFYNYDGAFIPGQLARAESVAAEFTAVQVGFALLSYDGTDSGTANTYVVTTGGSPTGSYSNGQLVRFQAKTTGTGPGTINVNAVGAVALTRFDGSSLQSGDVTAGVFYTAQYDAVGGKFRITSPAAYTTSAGTVSGAAPTHLVGLVAAGGSSTAVAPIDVTFALDQGISPTWTGSHTFSTVPTFNAGTVPANRGGTGLATYAVGDLIYANGTASLARLADVATGSFLQSGGVGVAPAWGALPGSFSGFATPSASIGLAAIAGTAATATRSDGAPALSQAISPTWSGTHTFSNAITVNGAGTSIKGGVTITSPSAGTALVVNAATSGSESVRIIGDATFYSSYNSANSTRTGYLQFTTTAGVNLVSEIAQPLNFLTSAAARMSIAAGGAVTINGPSSGNALSVTGIANQNTQQINGSSTSGQSFGLRIDAGSNSSDRALYVGNQAASVQYFGVRGDGLVQAVDQGGALQDVGWRGTPVRTPAGNDTPTVSDRGKTVQAANGAVITMSSGVFAAGDAVTVAIANGAACTVAQGTSLSLVWAGNGATTGNRTLTGGGLCTILYLSTSFALISGAGLT